MLTQKTFKFDLIQYNLKYSVEFSATVDDILARELYLSLLKYLSSSNCSCDDLDFNLFINDQKNNKKYCFDNYSFNVKYIGEWVDDGCLKTMGLIQGYPCIYEIKELQSDIGNIDYYFLIKNISSWCDIFETDLKETDLCILKREKINNIFRFDVISQEVLFSPTEDTFDASLSIFSFKTNNVDKIEELRPFEKITLENDFEKYEKYFLPMNVDGYKHIISYTPYFDILQKIDKIETIEDLIKK